MDKNYWESYYRSHRQSVNCSRFADYMVREYFSCNRSSLGIRLLELGCGNGRDSLFFAHEGLHVSAIDQAQEQIDYLATHIAKTSYTYTPHFIAGDFTYLKSLPLVPPYDCIYSRFTLHSIGKVEQNRVVQDSLAFLELGGLLAIEVRGERNSLYGKGRACYLAGGEIEEGAFIYDGHYRRFLNFEQTCKEIELITCTSLATSMGGGGI